MKPSALIITALLSGAGAFVVPARAVEPPPVTQQPAAQSQEIAALVGQLGEDDFHIRLSAARKLKAMGPAVIPAVEKAGTSSDPEIRARAEDILQDVEHPQLALPQRIGFGSAQVRASLVNNVRIIEVAEPGRTIHIEIGPDGIVMNVAGRIEGNAVVREFKTKTPAQLKEENPEAFLLFQQYANNRSAMRFGIQRFQANGNIRLNGVFIGPVVVQPVVVPPQQIPVHMVMRANPAGDDLDGLEGKLVDQMKARNLPEAQQDEVKGLLKQVREGAAVNNVNEDARIRDYDRCCDALRKKLADLNLPDPGDALPPPASRRLGISILPEPIQGEGLTITHVQAGSRAEKIGLKEQDVIQKVNDKEIHTTAELRKIATDNAAGLVVKGLRDGHPFEQREAGEAPVLR